MKAKVGARNGSYQFLSWTEGDRQRTVQFSRPFKVDERRYVRADVWEEDDG